MPAAGLPIVSSRSSAFRSKTEERKCKVKLHADPKGKECFIHLYPIVNSDAVGVVIKLDGKGIKSQLCSTKKDILNFLDEIL